MKSTLVMIAIIAMASVQAQALTLKGATFLNEWNVTQAGQVLLKQDYVRAAATLKQIAPLKLKYNGYASEEICDLRGESPNGEPELAPCLKSHLLWAPQFNVEMPVQITTTLEDIKSTTPATVTASLNECVENYETLKVAEKPEQVPAHVTLKPCDFYVASGQLKIEGKSAALANSQVVATSQILLVGQLQTGGDIESAQASPAVAQAIAASAKTLKSAGLGSQLNVQAKVVSRDGTPVELFNSSLEIDLK